METKSHNIYSQIYADCFVGGFDLASTITLPILLVHKFVCKQFFLLSVATDVCMLATLAHIHMIQQTCCLTT